MSPFNGGSKNGVVNQPRPPKPEKKKDDSVVPIKERPFGHATVAVKVVNKALAERLLVLLPFAVEVVVGGVFPDLKGMDNKSRIYVSDMSNMDIGDCDVGIGIAFTGLDVERHDLFVLFGNLRILFTKGYFKPLREEGKVISNVRKVKITVSYSYGELHEYRKSVSVPFATAITPAT